MQSWIDQATYFPCQEIEVGNLCCPMPDEVFPALSKLTYSLFCDNLNSPQDHFVLCLDTSAGFLPPAMARWQGEDTSKVEENQKNPLTRWCPNCHQGGRNVRLKLYQINLEDAMFLCTEEKCAYPFLEPDIALSIIHRPFSRMKIKQKRRKRNPTSSKMELKEDISSLGDTLPHIDQLASFLWADKKTELFDMDSNTVVTDEGWNFAPDSVNQNIPDGLDSIFMSIADEEFDNTEMNVAMSTNLQQEPPKQNAFMAQSNILGLTQTSDKGIGDESGKELGDIFSDVHTPVLAPYKVAHTDKITVRKSSLLNDSLSDDISEPCSFKNRLVIQWQNDNSLCWLDVLLNCIVNSSCIRAFLNGKVVKHSRRTHTFYRLCAVYDYVQERYNVNLSEPAATEKSASPQHSYSSMLNDVRKDVFELLQKQFSFKQGVDQSVHEMFSNFLTLDSQIHELFSVQIRWELECSECNFKRIRRTTTDIISFPSTSSNFHPLDAYFDRTCFSCSAKNQAMHMIMEIVPPCLMMHFQNGLPHNQFKIMDFAIQDHLYSVTAVIQYLQDPFKHFVVWIRNCKKNLWLCCDDLKGAKCQWKRRAPKITPNQIHMIMWEKQGRAPSTSPEDHQRWLSSQLELIYNEDAMLSGDEFPREILVEPSSTSVVDLEDASSNITKVKGSGNQSLSLERMDATQHSASSPPSPSKSIDSEDESQNVSFTEEDIEMLSLACEELKSCPPSPVLNNTNNFLKLEPGGNVSSHVLPLTNQKALAVVPYSSPVTLPQRSVNSRMKMKQPLHTVSKKYQELVNTNRPRSRLGASFEPFRSYDAQWDSSKSRRQKLRLTSHRKSELKMYYSDVNRKSSSKSEACYPRYKALPPSNTSSEKSSELSDLSDIFTDLDVFSCSSELCQT